MSTQIFVANSFHHLHFLLGTVEVDKTYKGGQDGESWGGNESSKKNVVIDIKKKGRGISRRYGKVIPTTEKKHPLRQIKEFMISHIYQQAQVRQINEMDTKDSKQFFRN